jgi:hypothetical protein
MSATFDVAFAEIEQACKEHALPRDDLPIMLATYEWQTLCDISESLEGINASLQDLVDLHKQIAENGRIQVQLAKRRILCLDAMHPEVLESLGLPEIDYHSSLAESRDAENLHTEPESS